MVGGERERKREKWSVSMPSGEDKGEAERMKLAEETNS
jgi:hypothetical protein